MWVQIINHFSGGTLRPSQCPKGDARFDKAARAGPQAQSRVSPSSATWDRCAVSCRSAFRNVAGRPRGDGWVLPPGGVVKIVLHLNGYHF